jgi:hypothetical protein
MRVEITGQVRDDIAAPAAGELHVGQVAEHAEPALLEHDGLGRDERGRDAVEGRAAPEGESGPEQYRGAFEIRRRDRAPRRRHHGVEYVDVARAGRVVQPVARR